MTVGLLSAEWTKIRSVRSTLWSLLAFMVVAIGFSALIIIVISNTWNSPGNHPNHVRLLEDPTAVLFGAGFGLGQLAICVLGVIVMSSEYSTGAIRASLLAVPRRLPMLAAKAIVFALLDLVVSAITVFAVFFITTAMAVLAAFGAQYSGVLPIAVDWSAGVTAFMFGFGIDQLRDRTTNA